VHSRKLSSYRTRLRSRLLIPTKDWLEIETVCDPSINDQDVPRSLRNALHVVLNLNLGFLSLNLRLLVYLVGWYIGDGLHAGLQNWFLLFLGFQDIRSGNLGCCFRFAAPSRSRGFRDLVAAWPGLERSRSN
jgi:hypothetical protein